MVTLPWRAGTCKHRCMLITWKHSLILCTAHCYRSSHSYFLFTTAYLICLIALLSRYLGRTINKTAPFRSSTCRCCHAQLTFLYSNDQKACVTCTKFSAQSTSALNANKEKNWALRMFGSLWSSPVGGSLHRVLWLFGWGASGSWQKFCYRHCSIGLEPLCRADALICLTVSRLRLHLKWIKACCISSETLSCAWLRH